MLIVSFHCKSSKKAFFKAQSLTAKDVVMESPTMAAFDDCMAPYVKPENWPHLIYQVQVAN